MSLLFFPWSKASVVLILILVSYFYFVGFLLYLKEIPLAVPAVTRALTWDAGQSS